MPWTSLQAALLSKEVNYFERVAIVLTEGLEAQANRFAVRDLVSVPYDTLHRFGELTTCVFFEPLLPFLTEASG